MMSKPRRNGQAEKKKASTGVEAKSFSPVLGVNATLADGIRHPVDRQHIRGDAVVHVMRLRVANHIFERRLHDGVELLVDHRLFPEVSLTVLHPLEIRSGDA